MTAAPAALQRRTPRTVPSGRRGRGAGVTGRRNAGPGRGSGTSNAARGAVTAEFAVVLPAVLALLAMLLAGAAAGATQLRIEEGARAGARALARGEDPARVERTVRTLAGGTAAATVAAEGGWYSITVTDRVGGPLGSSLPWILTARASTRSEAPAAAATGGLTDGRGNR
ncbi:TadE family type IV pilus minor pilin [Pseudarthrobacter sp. NPDC089323]